jgi:hypothetical protein
MQAHGKTTRVSVTQNHSRSIASCMKKASMRDAVAPPRRASPRRAQICARILQNLAEMWPNVNATFAGGLVNSERGCRVRHCVVERLARA